MKNINWKVRMQHKYFLVTLIPAILLLAQSVGAIFGIELEIDVLNTQLINIVEALFVILTILGIVVDPTTDGISDSSNALQYTSPKKDDSVG